MNTIETEGLTKIFYQKTGVWSKKPSLALDGVDLAVQEGEMFGLMGPNGSGKTTLLKILATLVLPTTGKVRINHYDLSQGERIRACIGFVGAEEHSFTLRLTGRQNLEFYASLHNLFGRRARERIDEIISWVGLSDIQDRWFQYYSTGMRRRLGIARALLHDPGILLLDEPAKDLDPIFALKVMAWCKKELVGRRGKTVMISTHRLEEAQELCDRVAIIEQGRLRWCGRLHEMDMSSGRTFLTPSVVGQEE